MSAQIEWKVPSAIANKKAAQEFTSSFADMMEGGREESVCAAGQGVSSHWGSTSQARDRSAASQDWAVASPTQESRDAIQKVKTSSLRKRRSCQGSPEVWELGPATGRSRALAELPAMWRWPWQPAP